MQPLSHNSSSPVKVLIEATSRSLIMATYSPGMVLTVGSHTVTIEKYLSKGGFATVYTARCSPPAPTGEIVCLKRVAVPTKALLNLLRAEVEAMQRLEGAPQIVQYIDSHAERNRDPAVGGYEVFVLMEFCAGGGLIDFMNTRLRDQLREHEVLKIMYDITWGLAEMHAMNPPLIHRDLKIENVLLTGDGGYKLCDFGSASPVLRAPKNPQELQILDDDIQHHTTAQYRSPEMLDLYRGFPIDDKSDIWALGVFLYKLCFYTTPFEKEGVPAIMSASYIIPTKPAYSDRLKNVIRVLLQPNPQQRPNAYQVMIEICSMRGVPNPLETAHHHVASASGGHSRPLPVHNSNHALSSTPHLSDYSKSSDSQSSLRRSGEYSRSPESHYYKSPELDARAPVSRTTPEIQNLSLNSENPRDDRKSFDFGATASPLASPVIGGGVDGDESFDTKFPPLSSVEVSTKSKPVVPKPSLAPQPVVSAKATPAQVQQPPLVPAKSPNQLKSSALPSSLPSQVKATNSYEQRPKKPEGAKPQVSVKPTTMVQSQSQSQPPQKPQYFQPQSQAPASSQPSQTSSQGQPSPAQPSQAQLIQERARAQIDAARAAHAQAQTQAQQHQEAPERAKLKKILGGLNERTNTVVLSNDSHVDSSMDFLRTLNTKEQPGERSSSGGSHHHHLHIKGSHARRSSWLYRSNSRAKSREREERSTPEESSFASEAETSETTSLDPFDSEGRVDRDASAGSGGSPGSSMRGFKPTNTIQQRVHNLVSGTHTQAPSRLARGYGKFTDEEETEGETSRPESPISQKSKSTPSLVDLPTAKKAQVAQASKRPKPILHAATGPQKERPPKPVRGERSERV